MRFHSSAHRGPDELVFECHVFADSPGAASAKVKHYLAICGIEEVAHLLVMSVQVREDIATDLPVLC